MRIRYGHKMHEVFLQDDGTLDTVISVDGIVYRYDQEFAAQYRTPDGAMTKNGLRILAMDALDSMDA